MDFSRGNDRHAKTWTADIGAKLLVYSLHFKNLGRMPAVIDSCLFEIKPKTELPEKPVFSGKQDLSSANSW